MIEVRILMFVSNDVVHDARVLKEARALKQAGHEILCVGWDRTGESAREEEFDGVVIRRIRTAGGMRLLSSDVLRNPVWWRRAYRLARGLPFDAIHCHDLDTLPIGTRLRRRTGKPLVYDCHEVFGYMIEEDVPRLVVDYAFRMERRLAPTADRVIAVNESVQKYIESVTGQEAVVVRNCAERVLDAYRPPPPGPFTVLYIGTLHPSRFVLEAIEEVGEMPGVRLVVGGSKRLTDQVRSMCALRPNTQFLGLVPNERVIQLTIDSHVVLALFSPESRINRVGLPNKIFEAMAAGRPSITTKGLHMGELVEREKCGVAVAYTKADFRHAVERLRDEPGLADQLGRNGLAAAIREYNWGHESRKLLALYDEFGRDGSARDGLTKARAEPL